MSNLVEKCPLPELAEALRPYIKPRNEVADIRRAIDFLLAQHIRRENVPLSRATLSIADTSAHSTHNIPFNHNTPFNGTRRAFIQALIARQKAQAQYDALKTELNHMQIVSDKPPPNNHENKENPVADTVALIRQRQRRDKLQLIEKALDNLEQLRQKSRYSDPAELLDSIQVQAPPLLSQQSQNDSLAEAQSHVVELQKAVLRAQHNVQSKPQRTTARVASTEDWKRAYALRRARDDLVDWIEAELATLSEDEQHVELSGDPGVPSLDEIKITLQHLYDEYITSRKHLIHALNTKNDFKPHAIDSRQQPDTVDDGSTRASLASHILPFIDTLRSTAHDEAVLMQQTSYLRRQIASVSADTEQLIVHLADESHMVIPGTSHTTAWTEAASEARTSDVKLIGSYLTTGESSITRVRNTLTLTQLGG
jgi:hypothetical protein